MPETRRPTTALCRYTDDAVFVRGVNLVDDLIGKVSFTEMIMFHLLGRKASAAEVAVLDAILVTLMEHGLTPSAIATRMVAMSSPEAMQAAIAAGLLAVGSRFIGTIEDSASLLGELVEAPEGVRARAEAVVRHHFAERRPIPGFGHHLHRPDDPRSPKLIAVARENGVAGRHVEALLVLAEVVDAVAGRHITINATGAIGAILTDLGIPREVVRGIAIISRAAGLVGHVWEERQDPAARFIWDLAEHSIDKHDKSQRNPE